MLGVLLQPYARPKNPNRDNYLVTLASEYDLQRRVTEVGANVDLTEFVRAHPTGKARIYSVGVTRPALQAWQNLNPGDLVLFWGHKAVWAYATVSSKVTWKNNNFVWPTGERWDNIYSLTDWHELAEGQRLDYQALREIHNGGKLDVQGVAWRPLFQYLRTRDGIIQYVATEGRRQVPANRLPTARRRIPEGLNHQHVQSALEWLTTNDLPNGFGERTDWVVVHNGLWIPPKAVIGVAVRELNGQLLPAKDFSGGEGPGQANYVLRNLGFEVIRREIQGIVVDPIQRWYSGLVATRKAQVGGITAPHQPSIALWLVSQAVRGLPRLTSWSGVRSELATVTELAGGGRNPESPVAALFNAGLLELLGIADEVPTSQPAARELLNQVSPQLGLPTDVYEELGAHPDRLNELTRQILRLIPDEQAASLLLNHLGLAKETTEQSAPPPIPAGAMVPGRGAQSRLAIERNVAIAEWVKKVHNDTCQLCGAQLITPGGTTSDAAHIKPLGEPHAGPDIVENVMCLCPNHHRLFDRGAWVVLDGFIARNNMDGTEIGLLHVIAEHAMDPQYFAYHRELIANQREQR